MQNRALVSIKGEVAVLSFLAARADVERHASERRALLNEDPLVFHLEVPGKSFTEAVMEMSPIVPLRVEAASFPVVRARRGGAWLEAIIKLGFSSLPQRYDKWALRAESLATVQWSTSTT